jgi:hypothetical protein
MSALLIVSFLAFESSSKSQIQIEDTAKKITRPTLWETPKLLSSPGRITGHVVSAGNRLKIPVPALASQATPKDKKTGQENYSLP